MVEVAENKKNMSSDVSGFPWPDLSMYR